MMAVTVQKRLKPGTRGGLFYFWFFAAAGAFIPFLNVYFVELGLNGRQVGWLAALPPLVTLLLVPNLTALADRRRRRRRAAQIALVGLGLALLGLRWPDHFLTLAPLMFFYALCYSPILPLADSITAGMAQRYQLDYGQMRLWGSLGYAVSNVASGWVWQQVGYGWMFLAAGVLFLPLTGVVETLEEIPTDEGEDGGEERPWRVLARDRGLLALLAAAFLTGVSFTMTITFEGIYMSHLGGGELAIGLLFGLAALFELPTMHYSGALGRRIGRRRVLLISFILLGSAYLAYTQAATPGQLALLGILRGLGFGLFFPTGVALAARRAGKWAATAQAALAAATFGLAPLLANPAGGALFDAVGPASVFLAGATAVGLAALLMIGAGAADWFDD
jgi:MFS family permease